MYMYMYPIAFGQPAPGPRDVGMSGCLAVCLFGGSVGRLSGWLLDWLGGCVVRWLANHLTGQPTNRPSWLRKPSKWKPQSFQNPSQEASWRGLGGSLGGVLGPLGGSWGGLGPKMAPRAQNAPKSQRWFPLFGAMLGPKIGQNRSQERSKK